MNYRIRYDYDNKKGWYVENDFGVAIAICDLKEHAQVLSEALTGWFKNPHTQSYEFVEFKQGGGHYGEPYPQVEEIVTDRDMAGEFKKTIGEIE